MGKSVGLVIGALVPVVYCGALVWYFFGVGGSVEGVETIGLGPTILGLAIVGLLFCIPLIIKLFRALSTPRAPGSDGRNGPTPPTRKPHHDDGDDKFDAVAAIARYMARQSAEATAVAAPAPSPIEGAAPSSGPIFGRKAR